MSQPEWPKATFNTFSEEYGRLMRSVDRAAAKGSTLLGEARILLELRTEPQTAAELARSLVVDAGQLSRHLASLERQGLLAGREKGTRKMVLQLTDAGALAAKEALDRRNAQIDLVLQSMSPAQRARFYRAISDLSEQLDQVGIGEWGIHLRDGQPGDVGLLMHGVVQSRVGSERGQFDQRYERYVARLFANFLEAFVSQRDLFLIAEKLGVPVGSIMLSRRPNEGGHIPLLYVHHHATHQGIEGLLLEKAVDWARERGRRIITAQTHSRSFGEGIFSARRWELLKPGRRDEAIGGSNVLLEQWRLDLSQPS